MSPEFKEIMVSVLEFITPFIWAFLVWQHWILWGRNSYYKYRIKKMLPKINFHNGFTAHWIIKINTHYTVNSILPHNMFYFKWNKKFSCSALLIESYIYKKQTTKFVSYFYDFEKKTIICGGYSVSNNNCQLCKNNIWINKIVNRPCEIFFEKFGDVDMARYYSVIHAT